MTTAKAVTKYVRVSPKKARLAAGLVRGLGVGDAGSQLTFAGTKAGRLLLKTLNSAVANAENNMDMRRDDLKVLEVRIDGGPSLKRAKARSRGSRRLETRRGTEARGRDVPRRQHRWRIPRNRSRGRRALRRQGSRRRHPGPFSPLGRRFRGRASGAG